MCGRRRAMAPCMASWQVNAFLAHNETMSKASSEFNIASLRAQGMQCNGQRKRNEEQRLRRRSSATRSDEGSAVLASSGRARWRPWRWRPSRWVQQSPPAFHHCPQAGGILMALRPWGLDSAAQ